MTEKQEEKIVLTLNEEEQQTVDTPLTDAEKEKLTPADITAARLDDSTCSVSSHFLHTAIRRQLTNL